MTKYVFVTGGVVSSLGKGIAAASLAAILESRGIKVTLIKLDPYLNVDPGTMSPFQHGEVYVTEDGAAVTVATTYYDLADEDQPGRPVDDEEHATFPATSTDAILQCLRTLADEHGAT